MAAATVPPPTAMTTTMATAMTTATTILVSVLQCQLQARRALWMNWAETTKHSCQEATKQHQATLFQAQSEMDQAAQDFLAFQLEANVNMDKNGYFKSNNNSDDDDDDSLSDEQRRQEQEAAEEEEEERRRQAMLQELRDQLDLQNERLHDLQLEAEHEQARVQEAQALLQQAEQSSRDILQHLTKACQMYENAVGLEFTRSEEFPNKLGFVWTQLDPNDPDRPFRFTLHVGDGDDDFYYMHYCSSERVAVAAMDAIMEELNRTLDMGRFIRATRRAFLVHELQLSTDDYEDYNIDDENRVLLETPVRYRRQPRQDFSPPIVENIE